MTRALRMRGLIDEGREGRMRSIGDINASRPLFRCIFFTRTGFPFA